jgi:hypothetical protein
MLEKYAQNRNSSLELIGALEGAVIAASYVLTSTPSSRAPDLAHGLRTQVHEIGLSFFNTWDPVALHSPGSSHHTLSESDRWHFFEQQLQATCSPDGEWASTFSRTEVETMLDTYLQSAAKTWMQDHLQHVVVCRDWSWDAFDRQYRYGGIQHRHPYLVEYIARHHPDITIPG